MSKPTPATDSIPGLELARICDAIRVTLDDMCPNWAPLRAVLPPEWRAGFMWMGSTSVDGVRINRYKHGITRRYLFLDSVGRCYRLDPSHGRFAQASLECEVERVLASLEAMGYARSTAYDADLVARRNRRLAALGYRIVS